MSENEGTGENGAQGGEAETVESLAAKLQAATKDAEKWQALSRKNEDRAKENATAAQELARIQASNQTDEQKRVALEQAVTAAADRATKAELDLLRFQVADGKIPADDVALFLTGSDEETIRKQAERYIALHADRPAGPRPDLSQGGAGSTGDGSGTHALNGDPLLDALKSKLGIV